MLFDIIPESLLPVLKLSTSNKACVEWVDSRNKINSSRNVRLAVDYSLVQHLSEYLHNVNKFHRRQPLQLHDSRSTWIGIYIVNTSHESETELKCYSFSKSWLKLGII